MPVPSGLHSGNVCHCAVCTSGLQSGYMCINRWTTIHSATNYRIFSFTPHFGTVLCDSLNTFDTVLSGSLNTLASSYVIRSTLWHRIMWFARPFDCLTSYYLIHSTVSTLCHRIMWFTFAFGTVLCGSLHTLALILCDSLELLTLYYVIHFSFWHCIMWFTSHFGSHIMWFTLAFGPVLCDSL